MEMPLCSRCKKNLAVVFITKLENGVTTNEGLCLKCAKELGISPINDMMKKMGITEADLENLEDIAANMPPEAMGFLEGMFGNNQDSDDDDMDDEAMSQTPAMPFMNGIMPKKDDSEESGEDKKDEKKKNKKKKALNSYALDLCARARNGKIDRVIGRDAETERVIQILNRRQKNNPCLIGEPGVGKTAIAEGLAQKIVDGNVPYKLRNKEVWLLDMTAMVAGTQFRGQFEGRMKALIEEVKALGNIILVIDEVHNLVGAGEAEGSMNAANILKPALSRGEIQVIGATTFKEYRKYIEKDSALERRFQPVSVNEPSIEQASAMLRGIKKYYEEYHGVIIPDAVCNQAVFLSERYITDRFLPDKAIDLIDEACSDINLKNATINRRAQLRDKLKELEAEQELIVGQEGSNEVYELMARLKSETLQTQAELDALEGTETPVVTVDDLSRVIEMWTKIPAKKIKEQDFEKIINLEARLKEKLIGQDEAVEAVAKSIMRSRAGISPKKKPVSFIFVGPTGVGKTELVKQLTDQLFDTPDALIRLDMSEYMEKHSASKLIGAPPGYVGYDEAGQLTEKIRRNPYSVVLFDEIEKAHPDVLNVLLQILDDGVATDSQGRKVSFQSSIIIMTSNAGSDRSEGSMGFGKTASQQGRDKALKALSEIMRPEFINRIDEVIAFNQLSEENFKEIAKIMLNELTASLKDNGVEFTYENDVLDYLVKKSYSIRYGARNLRRTIQKDIEDKVAFMIVSNYMSPVTSVHLSVENDSIVVK
ncbi:MAG: ATP-dependent Clp protease ATP-binding subunit [Clostridia bacterium]|nr:ATP-dependent Clp protease ATP-binding subunit [Clostridia bacterium]